MPIQGDTVSLDTTALDRLIAAFPERAERMIEEDALAVLADAIKNTTRVDTGNMRRGWRARQLARYLWQVGTNVLYAPFHEFGTTRITPLPMLGPAVEALRRRRPDRVARLFRA